MENTTIPSFISIGGRGKNVGVLISRRVTFSSLFHVQNFNSSLLPDQFFYKRKYICSLSRNIHEKTFTMENYDRYPSFCWNKKIGGKWSGILKSGKTFVGWWNVGRGIFSPGKNFVTPLKFSSLSPDFFLLFSLISKLSR